MALPTTDQMKDHYKQLAAERQKTVVECIGLQNDHDEKKFIDSYIRRALNNWIAEVPKDDLPAAVKEMVLNHMHDQAELDILKEFIREELPEHYSIIETIELLK